MSPRARSSAWSASREREDHRRAGAARLHAAGRRRASGGGRDRRAEHPRRRPAQHPEPARQGDLLRAAGPGRRAQPVAEDRRCDPGRAARPRVRYGVAGVRSRRAGGGRVGRRSGLRPPLSASALRRPAAAGDDRDGNGLRTAGRGARRADDRAGRAHPGSDPPRAAAPARRGADGDGVRVSRPGRGRQAGRSGAGHVRRKGARARADRRGDRAPPPPLYAGPRRGDPGCARPTCAAGHSRRVGRGWGMAGRLRVRAALPASARALR